MKFKEYHEEAVFMRIPRVNEIIDFLWNLMKFKEFNDFHDFGPKTVPNPYDSHCLQPGAKMMIFSWFHQKYENWLKTRKFKNRKHENHRKYDFHKVLTNVGAGKPVFRFFMKKLKNH